MVVVELFVSTNVVWHLTNPYQSIFQWFFLILRLCLLSCRYSLTLFREPKMFLCTVEHASIISWPFESFSPVLLYKFLTLLSKVGTSDTQSETLRWLIDTKTQSELSASSAHRTLEVGLDAIKSSRQHQGGTHESSRWGWQLTYIIKDSSKQRLITSAFCTRSLLTLCAWFLESHSLLSTGGLSLTLTPNFMTEVMLRQVIVQLEHYRTWFWTLRIL